MSADQLVFNLDGIDWPENAFILEYQQPNDQYQLYVKSLPLKQLLKAKINWPNATKPVLELKPSGDLHHTQLTWQNGEITSLLTKFSQLSWQSKKQIPGLTNVYGALFWQPSEGHLELDGDHSVLSFNHLNPLTFDTLNVALDWKELSQGLRVSLDRLVLSHPNMILSARGVVDDPLGEAAQVRLKMDFAAKEAQFWLPYIPATGKPKFDEWLQHDIPRIGHASGRMMLLGPWKDFPFDNQNGEFFIQAHVNDMDILINKEWPINRHVDGDIQVDKRRLLANIDQADLMGVPIQQVNIVVPDIGLGKEVFLLHGRVDAPGHQVKSYIFASPLGKRFARWQGLHIDDSLELDLNLEVPLYPESDHVYAKGYLKFQNNPVSVDILNKPAHFEDVKGKLQFNEYGLTDGGLDGVLEGYPFTLRVQPLLKDKLGTELRFEGNVAIDYLQKLIPHPVFSLMKGRLIVTGLWTVYPNESDIDKLYINSSLIGMALDLPPPLGKSIAEIAPITVNISFHPKRRMDLEMTYAQRLKSKMAITERVQHEWVTTGDIWLGSNPIKTRNTNGLRLSGGVDLIDITEWQKVWNKWPKEEHAESVLDSLQSIDLHINQLKVLGAQYTHLGLQARYVKPQEWSFHLEQEKMAGDFIYNWSKNNLSGHIEHLDIDGKMPFSTSSPIAKWQPSMSTIPNLDISINSLNYNGIELGQLNINTTTKAQHWLLNTCTIQTPEYQLSMQGEWVQQDKKNNSNITAQLYIKNLAKGLERWHITPAIDAHNGQMKMDGKWPGPFYAFALKQLVGHMQLTLKDGRISHLDKETEGKLGLGKLLSILSLQTIPRRLKLDFSDLAYQGYSFDVFKGNFDIHHGI
ncbi:MAG TPA: DUF3971 domain-containing protein, partial [Legionellaceae bacterium]|nr:DUF3971 domain-containing protein [Legionellaceae bacterium]